MLSLLNEGLVNVLLGGLARQGAQQIAELGQRHVERIGAVLHRGERLGVGAGEVTGEQGLEAGQVVVVGGAPG